MNTKTYENFVGENLSQNNAQIFRPLILARAREDKVGGPTSRATVLVFQM